MSAAGHARAKIAGGLGRTQYLRVEGHAAVRIRARFGLCAPSCTLACDLLGGGAASKGARECE